MIEEPKERKGLKKKKKNKNRKKVKEKEGQKRGLREF